MTLNVTSVRFTGGRFGRLTPSLDEDDLFNLHYIAYIAVHPKPDIYSTVGYLIPRLHDRANIEQTSSKCIQNIRANCSTFARRLLDVC